MSSLYTLTCRAHLLVFTVTVQMEVDHEPIALMPGHVLRHVTHMLLHNFRRDKLRYADRHSLKVLKGSLLNDHL